MKRFLRASTILLLLILSVGTLHAQTLLRAVIVDKDTKAPIAGAKFGVSGQGLGVFSNGEGKIVYRKYQYVLEKTSQLEVSAEGYYGLSGGIEVLRKIQNSRGIIYLDKISDDIKTEQSINRINIFWDASTRSASRNPDEEISYLKEFLFSTNAKRISLVIFNEEIIFNQDFSISEKAITTIENILSNVEYKGISDYGILAAEPADEILLFAEEKPTFGMFELSQNIPVHIVNSSRSDGTDIYFESLAEYTTGTYEKLGAPKTRSVSSKKEPHITGRFLKGDTPVPFAIISKKGDLSEYGTDEDGYFKVPASEGDVLTFYSLGNFPKTLTITSEKNYRVSAVPKAEQLGEVKLSAKVKSRYAFDSIRQLDVVEGRTVPIRSIHKNEFNKGAFSIAEAINGLKGVKSFYHVASGSNTFNVNGKCAKVFIDGWLSSPDMVSMHVVENISIYDSPSMVIPCPSRIIITTRMHPDRIDRRLRKRGYEPQENNFYKEKVATLETNSNNTEYFQKKTITGVVRGNGTVVQGVSVLRRGTMDEVMTDADGSFSIKVAEGDILDIKSFGMYPKSLVVMEEDQYEINMIAKAEILDEVKLSAKREEEKRNITTAHGEKDRKSVGYKVENELSKYVSPADISFEQVALKLPGVLVDPQSKQLFYQRSFGALEQSPILIIVDGAPVSQSTLNTIDPQTITNISALKGVAATNKYGSQAYGGVLLVTTLNGTFSETKEKPDLTLKNNIYNESLPTLKFDAVDGGYANDMASTLSTKIKLEKYRKLKQTYLDKVDFYVDVAMYFSQIDAGAAREVRSDFALLAKDNVKALRILAYLNEHAGEFLKAQKVYERVLAMNPSNPQSYRDLALVYQETGEYNKSLELYINMLGNKIPGVDFTSLNMVLGNELKHLVSLHKHKIEFQRLPNDWLAVNFNIDVRMTASWSDNYAPFEFQFVNPDKRFYNWNSDANDSIHQNTTEEFVVDDAEPGDWLINVRYTGDENQTNIPPYLKYTLYKDFGTKKEQKVIKLVKLDNHIRKVTLDSFTY